MSFKQNRENNATSGTSGWKRTPKRQWKNITGSNGVEDFGVLGMPRDQWQEGAKIAHKVTYNPLFFVNQPPHRSTMGIAQLKKGGRFCTKERTQATYQLTISLFLTT